MHKFRRVATRIVLALTLAMGSVLASLSAASAQASFETPAPYALLMDYESGTVLYQKSADEPMHPASMAKLMTIAVTLDEVRRGRIALDDEFFVSEDAWRRGGATSGGSTMFAELNSSITVDDLLHSAIIQSGNDASIVLAEGIAGSETAFANMMNDLAYDIGLTDSHFTNSTGLPDPDMYVTARDLADLARYIIREFPDYYDNFAIPDMTWNNIRQPNRNELLGLNVGVDGLKTGHTRESGYGMVASTTEGGRRLIAVLHGLDSSRQRTEETRRLVTWGTRSFERVPAFASGETVGFARVYGGAEAQVALVGEGAIDIYIPRGSRRCLSASIVYHGPLMPPVQQGQRLAELNVLCNDQLIQTAPLYAAETVERGNLVRRATDAAWELALGWL